MPLFEEQAPQEGYSFVGSGFEDLVSELNTPKHDQGISEEQGLSELEQEIQESAAESAAEEQRNASLQMKTSVARSTAKLFASGIDAGFSMLIGGLIAKDDPANYKADEDEKSEITDALTEFLRLQGAELPPWVGLVIIIVAVYGPKSALAFQLRKEKAKNEALEQELQKYRFKQEKDQPQGE